MANLEAIKFGDATRLVAAMKNYVENNASFESTQVVKIVNKELMEADDINKAALAPLRHKAFVFDTALRWGFFLTLASVKLLKESGARLSIPFDANGYTAYLEQVYDLAVKTEVWDFCEEESEGESESESGGDD